MTTSGTVGNTVIDTSKLIEHALRRCRVKPALQTPEIITTAKESLYMLLLTLANRGLNLWCIETDYVGIQTGQSIYDMPAGTIDVLNLVYSQPSRVIGTDTPVTNGLMTQLSGDTQVRRIGVKVSAVTALNTLTIESSSDGAAWTTVKSVMAADFAANTWYWYNLDPSVTATYFRASFSGPASVSEFYLASSVYDLPLTQWNRDTWSAINNKSQQGRPSTSYYYEKLLNPRVTLWPVPNNDYDHLTVFRHRQVQDIGTLVQTVEVPQRWMEGIVWQLASRLCFELDIVDPSMIPNILTMADKNLLEVESNETDGAPIMLQPQISVYTR